MLTKTGLYKRVYLSKKIQDGDFMYFYGFYVYKILQFYISYEYFTTQSPRFNLNMENYQTLFKSFL